MRSLADTRFWELLLSPGIRQASRDVSEATTLKIWIAGHSPRSELSELEHPGLLSTGNHAPLDTEETSGSKKHVLTPAQSRDAIVSGRILSLGQTIEPRT